MAMATPSGIETLGELAGPASNAPAQIGEYVLLGELGRGGMGVVFRAEDPHLKREVALKVMLPQFASNPQAKARFVREARAQAKVEHDHVAAIHQVAEHEGLPYLVMPLLKGMTLHAALRANSRPPINEVIRIGRETAEGLAAAHEKGLVHRDIKPANIWLEGKKLRVKVLDFGLARIASDADAEGTEGPVTREGAVVGTPAYMSPEQGRGLPVDGRTDLFSLGVMLYQMTTGELPFRGSTTLAILTALAVDNPPPPITRNPAVPPHLSDFVMRLLAKDPAYRPPTAEIAAEELRAIEAGMVNAVRVIPLDAPPPIILAQDGPDPFAELDATEVNTAPDAEPVHETDDVPEAVPVRSAKQGGGIPMWAVVGGVLLAVAGVVGLVASQMAKKPEVVLKEESPVPSPAPKREMKPPLTSTQTAVAWVLKSGGTVSGGIPGSFVPVTDPATIPGTVQQINLPGPAIDATSLENLRGLPSLHTLELGTTPLTDSGFKTLAGLPLAKTLESLAIRLSELTDSGLDQLVAFPNLKHLSVKGQFTPEGLAKIRNLSNLRELALGGSDLTDAHLASLKDLPLTYLYLGENNRLTDTGLANLGQMKSLTNLTFDGTGVTDAGLRTVVDGMPALTGLSLTDLSHVTNAGLEHLKQSRIRVVSIGASNLTTKTVTPLPRCRITVGAKIIAEPSDAHFREANRLVNLPNRRVTVKLADGTKVEAVKPDELPDEPFTLVGVELSGGTPDEVKRLVATPTLEYFTEAGGAITSESIRALLASKGTLALFYSASEMSDDDLKILGEFTKLKQVHASGPRVTDAGVKHLTALKELTGIALPKTSLTSAGVGELVTLTALGKLELYDTWVGDDAVDSLSKLKGLTSLNITRTRITATGHAKLAKNLPKCRIEWEDPNRSVARWALEQPKGFKLALELPGGKMVVAESIENIPEGPFTILQILSHGATFTDSDVRRLGGLKGLTVLSLRQNNTVSDVGVRDLLHLKDSLYAIDPMAITDAGMETLAAFSLLRSLSLGSGVTDRGIKQLAALPKLETLLLTNSNVSDASVEVLGQIPKLTYLYLHRTRITEAGYKKLQAALPTCKIEWTAGDVDREIGELVLKRGGTLGITTPAGFIEIKRGDKLPEGKFTIKGLNAELSKEVQDDDVKRIAQLRELDTLIIASTSVTNEGIAHLTALPQLHALFVGGLPLTDDGILPLKKFSLLKLHIGETKITDASIPLIAGFDKLDELNLFKVAITDEGLKGLAKLQSLRKLMIGQTKVTEAGVKQLAKSLPQCSIEWDGGIIEPTKKP